MRPLVCARLPLWGPGPATHRAHTPLSLAACGGDLWLRVQRPLSLRVLRPPPPHLGAGPRPRLRWGASRGTMCILNSGLHTCFLPLGGTARDQVPSKKVTIQTWHWEPPTAAPAWQSPGLGGLAVPSQHTGASGEDPLERHPSKQNVQLGRRGGQTWSHWVPELAFR